MARRKDNRKTVLFVIIILILIVAAVYYVTTPRILYRTTIQENQPEEAGEVPVLSTSGTDTATTQLIVVEKPKPEGGESDGT